MKLLKFLPFLLFALSISACLGDDDDVQPQIVRFVDELINTDPDLDDLEIAMARTGLDSVLSRTLNFTVFGPTDEAFAAAGIDVRTMDSTALTNALRYHLLGGTYFGRQNQGRQISYINSAFDITPNGAAVPLLIAKGDMADDIVVNGSATVVGSELAGSNGIVQKIDRVLVPPTLLQTIRNNDLFTDFAELVDDSAPLDDGSSVADSLNATGPITLFIPLNGESTTGLDYNASESRSVVLYHMLGGRNDQLAAFPSSYTTLEGGRINVNNRNLFTESDQSVLITLENIQCTNGILHITDEILLPEGF